MAIPTSLLFPFGRQVTCLIIRMQVAQGHGHKDSGKVSLAESVVGALGFGKRREKSGTLTDKPDGQHRLRPGRSPFPFLLQTVLFLDAWSSGVGFGRSDRFFVRLAQNLQLLKKPPGEVCALGGRLKFSRLSPWL